MAPAPRNNYNKHGIDNLYIKFDSRTKKFYCNYIHPITGVMHGLKASDKTLTGPGIQLGKQRAKALNAALYQQIEDHRVAMILNNRPASSQLTMSGWLVEYRKILDDRYRSKEIAESTCREGKSRANVIDRQFGAIPLRSIEVKQVADWFKTYKAAGKSAMGANLRKWMIDIFVEAIQAGECEDNPAEKTAKLKVRVKRARLTLDTFKAILAVAEEHYDPWVANSMLLSLVTAQALQEVNVMQFKHVKDGYLEVVRKKTGAKIKIPVTLSLEVMGISLEGTIRRCRDDVVSSHLLHHTKSLGNVKKGGKIYLKTISEKFAEVRSKTGLMWGDYEPPSFHEIRSLSERLYKSQGINTQSLCGHKHARTTDEYHDARGHDWVVVQV